MSTQGSFYTGAATTYSDTNPAGPADAPNTGTPSVTPGSFYQAGTNNSPLALLAGIAQFTPITHSFLTGVSAAGLWSYAQPAFTDISGLIGSTQLPTPTLSTLGGVEASAPTTHQWLTHIDTAGVPHLSQPAFSDISGVISGAQVSGAYTGITGVGTLTAGTIGTGFTAIANSALANSSVTISGHPLSLGGTLSLVASDVSGLGTFATQNYASPPAIGGTTPNTGAFSNLTITTPLGLSYGGLGGSQAAATANQIPVYPGASGAAVPTGVSAWLDSALSSTIGQVVVRASGGWVASALGYANPVWWGADPTATTDSTAALNSAIAASSRVVFPVGKFKFASQITKTIASATTLRIEGAGPDATTLYWPAAAGGIALTLTNGTSSFHVEGLSLTVGTTNGGTALSATQSATIAAAADVAPSSINSVTVRGDDGYAAVDYWSVGININKVSNVSFSHTSTWGASGIAGVGTQIDGVATSYSVVLNFNDHFAYANTVGLKYGVTNGYVQGVTIANSNFTACTDCVASGSTVVGLAQLSVSNTQFNYMGHGIITPSAIEFALVNNCLFLPQANSAFGIAFTKNQSFSVVGNSFQSGALTGTTGVYVGTTTNGAGVIEGNNFSFMPSGTAILLDTPSTNILVGHNGYYSVGTTITNSGTGNFVPTGTGNPVLAASPALTGTPTAPTAAVDTNTTQLATTAMVLAQSASATPLMDGVAAVGTTTRFARGDHVHPTDTTRAALAGATFTGAIGSSLTPTASASNLDASGQTAVSVANGANSAQIAPTVIAAVLISETSSGDCGLYLMSTTGVLVASNKGTFVASTTTPAAGKCCVSHDGVSGYRIYNNVGATNSFKVCVWRMF